MQTITRILAVTAIAIVAACGGDDHELSRDQQQYEVVQEGAGGAVTSTLHAPGEVMPPLTATNADTTTAFTLPVSGTDATMTDPPPPGSLAETLPRDATYPPTVRRTTPQPAPAPAPAPAPVPQPQRQPLPPPTQTTSTPAPAPAPEREPEPEREREREPDPEPEPQPQPEPQPPPPPTTTETDTAADADREP